MSDNIFLLNAFIFGIRLSIIYDVGRIFRRTFRHSRFREYLEDFLFWIMAFALTLDFLYQNRFGEIRWFAVCGSICGVVIYEKLLGCRFVKIGSFVLGKIVSVVFSPFIFLKRWLKNTIEVVRIEMDATRQREEADIHAKKEE